MRVTTVYLLIERVTHEGDNVVSVHRLSQGAKDAKKVRDETPTEGVRYVIQAWTVEG